MSRSKRPGSRAVNDFFTSSVPVFRVFVMVQVTFSFELTVIPDSDGPAPFAPLVQSMLES